ncbi:DUF2510 domain-containing protein [Kitasatospora sp. NBC_01302]|uniref:DUF2510 domain-containing protein n=1 Tax=Kitasatospora sp. NBC_01302 TaxID=2903575 RepID=UPI002E113EC4|nr:DUF2510 domain-containing protein [Kitasatospora sp. NBC_01302]
MSNFTPPGWYPDPEPAAGAHGARERFWDGTAWTARTRPLPPSGAPFATAPHGSRDGAAPPSAVPPLGAVLPPGAVPPAPPLAPAPAPQPSARPVVAGPAEPPSSLSDASPAYGHPAIPEPAEGIGYGYPAPVATPAQAPAQPQAPAPLLPGPAAVPPPFGYRSPDYPAPPPARRRTGLIVGALAGALIVVVLTVGVSIVFLHSSRSRPVAAALPPVAGHGPLPSATGPSGNGAPVRPTGPVTTPAGPPSAGAGALPPGIPAPGTASPGSVPPDASPASPGAGPVPDAAHNWSVPLPQGWSVAQHDAATTLLLVTGPYQCATPGGCVRGNFEIDSRTASGPDAQTVARQTMSDYAPQLFGQLDSHEELASGPVTVAGQSGFAVRWHVVPAQAGPGYLLLIALPAPGGGFTTMVGSVDDDPQAPGPAVLDQIATGIQPAATAPNAT